MKLVLVSLVNYSWNWNVVEFRRPPVLLHDLHWISAKMNSVLVPSRPWNIELIYTYYIYIYTHILYVMDSCWPHLQLEDVILLKIAGFTIKRAAKSAKVCGFIHHIFTNCGLIANDGRTTIIRWSSPADNRFSTSVDAPWRCRGAPKTPKTRWFLISFPIQMADVWTYPNPYIYSDSHDIRAKWLVVYIIFVGSIHHFWNTWVCHGFSVFVHLPKRRF